MVKANYILRIEINTKYISDESFSECIIQYYINIDSIYIKRKS